MRMLKKLPWVTILVAIVVALKFSPDILGFLDDKMPSVSDALKPKVQ
jgi:hypothetical protein